MQGVLVIKGRSTTSGEQSPTYHRDLRKIKKSKKLNKKELKKKKKKLDVSYVKVQVTHTFTY